MLRGIDVCIQAQCLVSAVALIYSTIDAISTLARPLKAEETNRKIFIAWVTKYMRPKRTLRCSPADLYGARCGVFHKYGVNSRLRRRCFAKAIIYTCIDVAAPNQSRH